MGGTLNYNSQGGGGAGGRRSRLTIHINLRDKSQTIHQTADGPHKIIIAPGGAHGSHMSPPYMLSNMHAIIPMGKGGA